MMPTDCSISKRDVTWGIYSGLICSTCGAFSIDRINACYTVSLPPLSLFKNIYTILSITAYLSDSHDERNQYEDSCNSVL